MSTPAQLAACAANAQHSTGPRSPEGKAVSSRNALKFGLFAQASILPGEDPAELEQITRDFEEQFHPRGPLETKLVHDLVQGTWLEARYTRIETEVIRARFAALSPADRQYPIGAILIQDAEGHNVLEKIHRRRESARRQFRSALAELRKLRGDRPAPHPRPVTVNPVNTRPAPSVRFEDSPKTPPYTGGPTPVRTPSDNWDNPALRL